MTFSENFRQLREKSKISRKDLADQLGVTEFDVLQWEQGDRLPETDKVIKISKIFHVSLNILMQGQDQSGIPPKDGIPICAQEGQNKHRFPLGVKVATPIVLLLLVFWGIWLILSLNRQQYDFTQDSAALNNAASSVLLLELYRDGTQIGTGSAFIAFEPNLVVTCFHVIEGADEITAVSDNGMNYTISEVVAYDQQRDIALLRIAENKKFTPLEFSVAESQRGEQIAVIGSTQEITNIISTGTYNDKFLLGQQYLFRYTAPSSSESSGGPVFDRYGKVIGMAIGSVAEEQNLNLGILAGDITALYQAEHKPCSLKELWQSGEFISGTGTTVLDLYETYQESVSNQDSESNAESDRTSSEKSSVSSRRGNSSSRNDKSNSGGTSSAGGMSSGANENVSSSSPPSFSSGFVPSGSSSWSDNLSSVSEYIYVTIDQLLASPQKYDGCSVVVTGWVSSSYIDLSDNKNECILVNAKEQVLSTGIVSANDAIAVQERNDALSNCSGSVEGEWPRLLVKMDSYDILKGGAHVKVSGKAEFTDNKCLTITGWYVEPFGD